MFILIKKDFSFNWKYLLLAIAISMIAPIGFAIEDAGSFAYWMYFFTPYMASAYIVNRICYIDDSPITRYFLNTLPIKKSLLVISKYVDSLISIVVSLCILTIFSLILSLPISFSSIILSLSFLILYYSIYMFLYFVYDYSFAQKTTMIVIFTSVGFMIFINRSNINIDIKILDQWYFLLAIFLFAIIAFFLSIKATVKKLS